MILKKKQVGGHKTFFYIFFFTLIFSKVVFSSQIYDYQTEKFINNLNEQILSVNNYNKKINFIIINDTFPNAFVTEDNNLFLSSGLLIYCPDYVSLLAVLAHEIGHLEKYHVTKRKNEINNLKKINSISNLVAIAGSMIMQEPELINGLVVGQTTINNLYLSFSQEQEVEADIYAVNTLDKLKLPKKSVKDFLKLLEDKSKFNLIDNELKKFSTHPLFKDRYELLDSENKKNLLFNKNFEKEFRFIKAKFIAYTNNENSYKLKNDEKIYYNAIRESLNGNLIDSLKKLNYLINNNNNNEFIIETKADILLSYGYNKEAIEFYKQVLKKQPENKYINYNIFVNSNYLNKEKNFLNKIFEQNQILIKLFPTNKDLITKYYKLSVILEKKDWISFFDILLFKIKESKAKLTNLKNNTKDNNLKKIINLYI